MKQKFINSRFVFSGQFDDIFAEQFDLDQSNAKLSSKFKLYYRLRPYIPIPLRQMLQRGRNQSIDVPEDWYLPSEFVDRLKSAAMPSLDESFIHPWPDDLRTATVLTHDVETNVGVALTDELAKIEESFGLRSSWNFIPYKYDIDPGLIKDLKQRGHEIGVHGYNHDGRLFESLRTFGRRCSPINDALQRFDCTGFRAPMVHRNLEWLQQLDVEYDASCFDVDPFQAMPGGVGGVWPFIVGKFVELPYTLPQDHTLLISLGEKTPRLWIDKMSYLREVSGMNMVITHPDYLDIPHRLDVYKQFLEYVSNQQDSWNALPHEVAKWWRIRDESKIDAVGKIIGPAASQGRVETIGEILGVSSR